MEEGIHIMIDHKESVEIQKGMTLLELSNTYKHQYGTPIVAAKVNNDLKELNYVVNEAANIEFIDLTKIDGIRIYQRSLVFVFIRAAMEILPDSKVTIEHSLSRGLYCEIHYKRPIYESDVLEIEARMKEIVERDEPITKNNTTIEEAKEIFAEWHLDPKIKLLDYKTITDINIYSCGWLKNYFYGYMVPSTGYLKLFKLKYYMPGIILIHPEKSNPNQLPEYHEQHKMAAIFKESANWAKIMNVEYVASLNHLIEHKKHGEIIRVAEALHEKKIAHIADLITQKKKRIVLIAGPSSSGKTTFAQKLIVQLKVNGLNPVSLSTDDYFVNRELTPRDEKGEYNFEALEAVDVDLFNEHLTKLILGEVVEIPSFNFQKGIREYKERFLKVKEDQPIIIEGIHGLNERLTEDIPHDKKFKIYISALTQLNIDDHNRINTTDTRLIRRIIRDNKYRGKTALDTLKLWESVRRGEEKYIFPYQEDADIMFNSSLIYELAVLKKHIEPLLLEISMEEKEYSEAKRLLKFLSYFLSIVDDCLIPKNSLIREFIGGSWFYE
ncbi:uridine kinase [Anaerosolibacter carboniphilus]|uniref:Uridine kinase n=1 Tax=Anaerosolibacter carboniphilus TaxID=1417629 RepID=A0A841KQS8_9FIRM|nr:nucleoside kinase [Anaerosolibacter carboniphilus]MBB6215846.1 uridine kinase [Anaerosolibacter carboniphilus]